MLYRNVTETIQACDRHVLLQGGTMIHFGKVEVSTCHAPSSVMSQGVLLCSKCLGGSLQAHRCGAGSEQAEEGARAEHHQGFWARCASHIYTLV